MIDEVFPKISCLMVTKDRPDYVRKSAICYFRQTYPNKELVIISHGNNLDVEKYVLMVGRKDIIFVVAPSHISLGEVRNLACEVATGSLLCQWDDDDLCSPHRLLRQYRGIQSSPGAVASGYNGFLKYFQDLGDIYWCDWSDHIKQAWRFLPGSIMFSKSVFHFWRSRLYPERNHEEDFEALRKIYVCGEVVPLSSPDYIYVYHGNNTYDAEHHFRILKTYTGRALLSAEQIKKHQSLLEEMFQTVGIDRQTQVKSSGETVFVWYPKETREISDQTS